MRHVRNIVAPVLAGLVLSGCAAAPPPTAADLLADRAGSLAGAFNPMPFSVSDAMPRVEHPGVREGEISARVSDAVVVGSFTAWEPAGRRAHPDQPGAWDVYSDGAVLELSVDEVIEVADGVQVETVEQVLIAGADPEGQIVGQIARGLVDLDRVVVFLAPVRLADREGFAVALDGSLIGVVDDRGALRWPVLEAAGEQLVARQGADAVPQVGPAAVTVDVETLEELRAGTR